MISLTFDKDTFKTKGGAAFTSNAGSLGGAASVRGGKLVPGRKGEAIRLDGRDDYVDTGLSRDIPIWTIALWVRSPKAPVAGQENGPIRKGRNFMINWDHANLRTAGSAALSVNYKWHNASFGVLAANTWYHLAATYDGRSLKTYSNGALVSTNGAAFGRPDSSKYTLVVGKSTVIAGPSKGELGFFTGDVDEVLVYSRALSAAEVAALAAGK